MTEDQPHSCFAPGIGSNADSSEQADETAPRSTSSEECSSTVGMIKIPGSEFKMGTDSDIEFPADGEGPIRVVATDPYYSG